MSKSKSSSASNSSSSAAASAKKKTAALAAAASKKKAAAAATASAIKKKKMAAAAAASKKKKAAEASKKKKAAAIAISKKKKAAAAAAALKKKTKKKLMAVALAAKKRKQALKAREVKSRLVSRRSLARGPQTAWIYYCNSRRDAVLKEHPEFEFGDIYKHLSPEWNNMSDEEKAPFVKMHKDDKSRYTQRVDSLSDDDRKMFNKHRKLRRAEKKQQPKTPLSPYMLFVMQTRSHIVKENPTLKFKDIGRVLGKRWKATTEEERAPFNKLSQADKQRYETENTVYRAKKRQREEEKRESRKELQEQKKRRAVDRAAEKASKEAVQESATVSV